jgi:two-component system, cell cycle response regulator CpdR
VPQGIILVVDDDDPVRMLMRSIVDVCADQVLEAVDGVDAFALVQKLGSRISLILTDVAMPRMNGIALAQSVRQTFPAMPIVLVTGSPETEWANAPADCPVVQKPFTPATLLRTVYAALGREGAAGAGSSVQVA